MPFVLNFVELQGTCEQKLSASTNELNQAARPIPRGYQQGAEYWRSDASLQATLLMVQRCVRHERPSAGKPRKARQAYHLATTADSFLGSMTSIAWVSASRG